MTKILPLFVLLLLGAVTFGENDVPKDIEKKARFIVDLLNEIDWPADVLDASKGVITVSVVAESLLASKLHEISVSEKDAKRTVRVKTAAADDDFTSSQIIFIATRELPELARILKRVEGRPILTLADVEGYARYGVMIEIEGGADSDSSKFELIINKMVLNKAGLKISDKLLKKAKKTFG